MNVQRKTQTPRGASPTEIRNGSPDVVRCPAGSPTKHSRSVASLLSTSNILILLFSHAGSFLTGTIVGSNQVIGESLSHPLDRSGMAREILECPPLVVCPPPKKCPHPAEKKCPTCPPENKCKKCQTCPEEKICSEEKKCPTCPQLLMESINQQKRGSCMELYTFFLLALP